LKPVSKRYWIAVVLASASTATLLRLLAHPILHGYGVFLPSALAAAISAHLAGLAAGLATSAVTIPLAAILFLGGPGIDSPGAAGWVNLALSVVLTLPLCFLGARFHRLVRELDQALHRERAARAEAERANRVRDEFLAVLSHELRSPLNAIVGWANILWATHRTGDDGHAVETILRNADHQVRLIADITDLSRGLSGKVVLEEGLVDVRAALDQAVDAVRLSADARKVHLQLVIPEAPLIVRGDAGRLRQVFWNLLSNAIKFSGAGGSVQALAAAEGDAVVVRVKDSGQGISADFLPHVFDSFRQEDATRSRRHGGLGLGLAIVRHLTEAHGGTVRAESAGVGAGASFTVILPVCKGIASVGVEAVDLSRPRLEGVRLLIVEDDDDTRELLVRSLGELGAVVTGAGSAAEARRCISAAPLHAIVSDIGMPGEDGLEFMRSLKKSKHGSILAIALTAYASTSDRDEVLAAGYMQHVPKPVHPYNLARIIATALRPPS
jgi:signal transduction histidine kinase/CheY-like chemotaxis protein